jgi:hypothetical protein
MLSVNERVGWDDDSGLFGNVGRIMKNMFRPTVAKAAIPLGLELFLGMKESAPPIEHIHPSLRAQAERLAELVRDFSHEFKLASKRFREKIVERQSPQARLADAAMWLHGWSCVLSKLDQQLRAGASGVAFERDKAAAMHFIDLCQNQVRARTRELFDNVDESMLTAADAALKFSDTLPNSDFVIPERSPIAQGTGKHNRQDGIKQFPGESYSQAASDSHRDSARRDPVTVDAK